MISMERRGAESAKWRGGAPRVTVGVAALVMGAIGWGGGTAAQEPLAGLAGVWRGSAVIEQQGLELVPGDLDRTIAVVDGTITLTRQDPGGGRLEVRLVASDRPTVLQPAPASSGLLSRMFGPGQGSPLDGDRLTWGRIDGTALVVYELAIDRNGYFTIDQERQVRDGAQLRVEVTRLRFGAAPARAVALLVRREG